MDAEGIVKGTDMFTLFYMLLFGVKKAIMSLFLKIFSYENRPLQSPPCTVSVSSGCLGRACCSEAFMWKQQNCVVSSLLSGKHLLIGKAFRQEIPQEQYTSLKISTQIYGTDI